MPIRLNAFPAHDRRLISRPDVGQDTLGGAASHSARLRQLNTMADVSSPVTASAEDVSGECGGQGVRGSMRAPAMAVDDGKRPVAWRPRRASLSGGALVCPRWCRV
jgi:hypothetical protein